MSKTDIDNITFENAEISFRNFEGREAPFNSQGKRNFVLYLPEDTAALMTEKGWNVAWTKGNEEMEKPPRPLTKVHLRFDNDDFPCNVVMITSKGRTRLNQDTVGVLDHVAIGNVDLIIRPFPWHRDTDGASGIKTMLKTMYFTVAEDDLERKYGVIGENPEDVPMGDAVGEDGPY
jgi:hypothetical protein